MNKFDESYQLSSTNSNVRKSLVYRRCEKVYYKIVSQGLREISSSNLRLLIKKYIGGSPQTVKAYIRHFVDFIFLKPHPNKPRYLVNYEKNIFSHMDGDIYKTGEKASFQPSLNTTRASKQKFTTSRDLFADDSKTLVDFEDRDPRVPFSVKVRGGLKKRYVKRVKSLGLDSCYVQEAWMNAFMVATDEARKFIQTPIQMGFSTLIVNMILPYVVSKPRRRRKRVVVDEEESW